MLMNKLQIKFGSEELRGYFSVNTAPATAYDNDDKNDWATSANINEQTNKVKCMPSAFPSAVQLVDKIYKAFNQWYFGANKEIEIRCDFIED